MIYTPQNRGNRTPLADTSDAAAGIQIKCPRCQAPYAAQIINVVDVHRHPQLKAALLGGYLNRATCPSCGAVAALNVPLVYHDPEKELLLVLAPSELNLPADQQERLIGGLVQTVMASVSPEERKGYFLRPETILSRQRLVERILEADGVTREMLDVQRARVRLLEELLGALQDSSRLDALIQEQRGKLDYGFFATLMAVAQEAELGGDRPSLDALLALRDRLLQDPEVAKRLPQPLPPDSTAQDAIEKLLPLADDPEALTAMVALNRPFLTYMFFQALTGQIEEARTRGDTPRAERLTRLRSQLLEEADQQDRAMQMAQQEDLRLIDELLASGDTSAAVRQRLRRIDSLFLGTLASALQKARQEGNIERGARLEQLQRTILTAVAESMPPEIRLINRLLSLERPEDRRKLLAESTGLLSDDLADLIEGLIAETQGQGRSETARRLQAIRDEVQQVRTAGATPSGHTHS